MRRFHIALGVADIDASIRDYSARLRCAPVVIVQGEYALWRTETINLSIRKVKEHETGLLRHLGWEDANAEMFTSDTDVNGLVWESFEPRQQKAEIQSLWPAADYPIDA